MKRITSVQLENFRAFHGQYAPILLPKGENVLIYGENGSGKSSLFKALNDYLSKSNLAAKPFVKNRHSENVPGSAQNFYFSDTNADNNVPFIQSAGLSKGFLEYRNLLDVYLHKEPRPNLFELIVENLLGNYIPNNYGATYRTGQKWKQLKNNLFNTHSKRGVLHRQAINELPVYDTILRATLDDIFVDLNNMLVQYFPNLSIQLGYILQPCVFHYSNWKRNWRLTSDLRLTVSKNGVDVHGDYSDVLNEARLSAFAICLYLASIKRNPVVDFQILYLDDIFIGLDAGNRLPILQILEQEFSEYQIFLSTYDRHWYEMAKRYFDKLGKENWTNMEFYVGAESAGGIPFDKPIITRGETNLDKGIKFLHHNTDPDYPAAANYFRKYLEELVPKFVPPCEISDSELHKLPGYKASQLLSRTRSFLQKIGEDQGAINEILSFLKDLIHPFSHFTITSPIYKEELRRVEKAIGKLEAQMAALDPINNVKCILGANHKIRFTFCVDAGTNHYFYYVIALKTALIIKNPNGGAISLCDAACFADSFSGHNGANHYQPGNPGGNQPYYHYNDIW
ncbi:MAG: ATP-binding protein [Chryseobacterium sp.]|nr:MAG: ATP-binding protein [Chryseobacterium sp.]